MLSMFLSIAGQAMMLNVPQGELESKTATILKQPHQLLKPSPFTFSPQKSIYCSKTQTSGKDITHMALQNMSESEEEKKHLNDSVQKKKSVVPLRFIIIMDH